MTTELDALMTAVIAAPDEDAPRMVLADYLIERGDPRGQLIVVQCKLARGDTSGELHDLERMLVERRVPFANARLTHDRGFVTAAKLTAIDRFAARRMIAFLEGEPLLRRLVIDGCRGAWDTVAAAIEATMARLAYLELAGIVWGSIYTDTGLLDETEQCAAMFERLPPRPATLVDLVVPEHTPLPAHWRS